MTADQIPPGVNPNVPTPARLYDYFLGGTNNLAHGRALLDGVSGVEMVMADLRDPDSEDPVAADTDDSRWLYCGVARRP